MQEKRTMTLNLSVQEMDALDRLSDVRGVSKTAVLKQALRLFERVTDRIEAGEKVFVEHPSTKEKAELMVL